MTSAPTQDSGTAAARAARLALACAVVGIAFGVGRAGGLAYLLAYVLATVPGWPIGFALFGRRHVAGLVAGALLGYALTALAFWAAISRGHHSPVAFLVAWMALVALSWGWFARRGPEPLVRLPAWTRRETAALCLVLLLVPALCSAPFLRVGARDQDGSRAYRAYFTMDFFWHTALTAELAKFSSPPRNPYLASQPLHYYWTYFVIPAAFVGTAPADLGAQVEPTLLVNALCTGVLLLAMVFLAAWSVVPRAGPVAAAVVLVTLASSAEGAYALLDLVRRGAPLDELRDLNVDAVTAWVFGGLRTDGLPRSFWWVPQHATACALALVALVVAAVDGARSRWPARLLAGCALGAAVTMSPFLGAAFSLVFGLAVLMDAAREPRQAIPRLAGHTLTAVPVVVALAWCISSGVLEGTSGAMKFGWGGLARHAPVQVLVLALGPVLLPSLAGLWPWRRLPPAAFPALSGLVVGLTLMYFVWVPLDEAYVGFRAGQVLLVTMAGLLALPLSRWWDDSPRHRAALAAAVGLMFVIGLPTTLVDWFNAQDVENRRMGPGFPWTITITPDEQDAFRWIRRATRPDATVQMETEARGRNNWTLIPTFAQRRMAAGMGYSLLAVPEFRERSARVHAVYATADPEAAWRTARDLGVDYLYMDRTERRLFPAEALAKFARRPDLFHRAFENNEVTIYAVWRGHE